MDSLLATWTCSDTFLKNRMIPTRSATKMHFFTNRFRRTAPKPSISSPPLSSLRQVINNRLENFVVKNSPTPFSYQCNPPDIPILPTFPYSHHNLYPRPCVDPAAGWQWWDFASTFHNWWEWISMVNKSNEICLGFVCKMVSRSRIRCVSQHSWT